jgi:hypothetical protein
MLFSIFVSLLICNFWSNEKGYLYLSNLKNDWYHIRHATISFVLVFKDSELKKTKTELWSGSFICTFAPMIKQPAGGDFTLVQNSIKAAPVLNHRRPCFTQWSMWRFVNLIGLQIVPDNLIPKFYIGLYWQVCARKIEITHLINDLKKVSEVVCSEENIHQAFEDSSTIILK